MNSDGLKSEQCTMQEEGKKAVPSVHALMMGLIGTVCPLSSVHGSVRIIAICVSLYLSNNIKQ
jgi:hypothetical protein